MANGTETTSCATTSWIVAAIVGVVIGAVLLILADWSLIQAAFAGIVMAAILGFILAQFLCSEGTAKADLESVRNGTRGPEAIERGSNALDATNNASMAEKVGAAAHAAADKVSASADAAATKTAAAAEAVEAKTTQAKDAVAAKTTEAKDVVAAKAASTKEAVTEKAASAKEAVSEKASSAAKSVASGAAAAKDAVSTKASSAFQMQPSKALSGEAELSSRKGDWKFEGEGAKKPAAKKAPAKKAPAKATAAKAKAPAAKSGAAKTTTAKRAPVAADGKPETLSKARAGGADDLKLISGVGPKLEGTLNEMGFWHFDQIAGWRKKEIEWVDSRLKFKGRIERDDWMSQAKVLAKGKETEFSKRSKT